MNTASNARSRPARGAGVMHYQYLSLLLISRLTEWITTPQGEGRSSALVAAALLPASAAALLVFLLPILWLNRINPGRSLTEHAGDAMGKGVMYAFAIIYALFFVASAARSVARFTVFFTSVQTGLLPQYVYVVIMFAAVLFASLGGVGPLSRAGFIMAAVIAAAIAFIVTTVISKIYIYGVYPPDWNDGAAIRSLTDACLHSAEVTAMGFLLPGASGRLKKSLTVFFILQTAAAALVLCLPLLVLGDYALRLQYPFFGATSIAGMGIITHLDAVYAGIWITGAFIQASTMCVLCGVALKPLLKGRYKRVAAAAVAAAAAALTFIAVYHFHIRPYVAADTALGIANAALGCVLPLVCAVILAIKKRRAGVSRAA